ncbi:MAG: hypothetical protein AAB563_00525 [Patescibacteria group bacterium]
MTVRLKYYWGVILIGLIQLVMPGEWIFGFFGLGFITSLIIVIAQIYLFRKGGKDATSEDNSNYSSALRVIAIISILYSAYGTLFLLFSLVGVMVVFR